MGTRRKSREMAMQMLFQGDLGKQPPEEVGRLFWASRDDVDAETRGFAEDLYRLGIILLIACLLTLGRQIGRRNRLRQRCEKQKQCDAGERHPNSLAFILGAVLLAFRRRQCFTMQMSHFDACQEQ